MAEEVPRKKRKLTKRKTPRRVRFSTADSIEANLASISKAKVRSQKRRRKLKSEDTDTTGEDLPIIENIGKSEQAWLNELRRVSRPEDLDDFE